MRLRRPAAVALAALSTAFALVPTADGAAHARQSATIYLASDAAPATADSPAAAEQRLDRLRSTFPASAGDFVGRARIAFKTERRPMVRARELVAAEHGGAEGWVRESGFHIWTSRSGAAVAAEIPMRVGGAQPALRLADFEQFWIDYTMLPGASPCPVMLELEGVDRRTAAGRRIRAWSGPHVAPAALMDIEPRSAPWERKGIAYLVARQLATQPDDRWFYSQDGARAVLQRRLLAALDQVDSIDLVLEPGHAVEHVNLRITSNAGGGGGELLMFPDLAQRRRLPDGRAGVRLDVRGALERRNAARPGHVAEPQLYLTEINVFAPGASEAVAAARPLRRVTLLGSAPSEGTASLPLPTRFEKLTESHGRIVADLRPLLAAAEFELTGATIRLAPYAAMDACAVRLDRVRAAAPYPETLPGYAAMLETWGRKWGDTAWLSDPVPGEVRHPALLAYLPFDSFVRDPAHMRTPSPPRSRRAAGDGSGAGDGAPGAAVPRWLSSSGAVLHLPDAAVEVISDKNSLRVRGEGPLRIEWPVDVDVDEHSRFFLGLSAERGPPAGATVAFETAGREWTTHPVTPNEAMALFPRPAKVKTVRLTLASGQAPYAIAVAEMALFRSERTPFVAALRTTMPQAVVLAPEANVLPGSAGRLVRARPGRLSGLASQDGSPFAFSTPLRPIVDVPRMLHLRYQFSGAAKAQEPCRLDLQLVWSDGRSQRRVCFPAGEGELLVPLLPRSGSRAARLERIEWALRAPPGTGFDLGFRVDGTAITSTLDRLRATPILESQAAPLFLSPEDVARIEAAPFDAGAWITLPPEAMPRVFAAGGATEWADNAIFKVEQVVIEPKAPIEAARWGGIATPAPFATQGGRAFAWTGAIVIAFGALLVWALRGSRGRFSRARDAVASMGWPAPLRRARARLPSVHAFVAVLALGPGLFIAGRLGASFGGVMIVVSAAIVLWGASRHMAARRSGTPATTPPGRITLLLAMAAGCFLWGIGRHGAAPATAWGLLPLLASAYAVGAGRDWVGPVSQKRSFVVAGAFAAVAAALYGTAAKALLPWPPNAVSIIAASAAAIAVSALVRGLVRIGMAPAALRRTIDAPAGAPLVAACLSIVAAGVAFALRRQGLAEGLAMVAYLCVLIAVAAAAWRRWRPGRGTQRSAHGTDSGPAIT